MPETPAQIQQRQILSAKTGLELASGSQRLAIEAAMAELEVQKKLAEITKLQIENQVAIEKLGQLQKAYKSYQKYEIKLKQAAQAEERKTKKLEQFVKQAVWFFDGSELIRTRHYFALTSMRWILSEFAVAAPEARTVVHKHLDARTMPAIGDPEYMAVVEALASVKDLAEERQATYRAAKEAAEAKLLAINEKHWTQVEVL